MKKRNRFTDEEIKEDIQRCLKITKKKNGDKEYAFSRYWLGVLHRYLGDTENRKKYYAEVPQGGAYYSLAQLSLGNLLEKNDWNKAEEHYSNIEPGSLIYDYAQCRIGQHYSGLLNNTSDNNETRKINKEKAITHYNRVEKRLGGILYFPVQLSLGILLEDDEWEKAKVHYQNIQYTEQFASQFLSAQIALSLPKDQKRSTKGLSDKVSLLVENVDSIRKELFLGDIEGDAQPLEGKVAHYTRPSVLINFLDGGSSMRLNMIDYMNDPKEGSLLNEYFKIEKKDSDIKTFLTSFAFNHNYLNQFRLYGNEEKKAGSGVSLIFKKDFFGNKNISSISISSSFSSLGEKIDALNARDAVENIQKSAEENKEENEEGNGKINKLPLYRCLYFDPQNGYMSLAKRSKYSFYLEEKRNYQKEEIDEDKIFEEDKKVFNAHESKFKTCEAALNQKIPKIMQCFSDIKKAIRELRDEVSEVDNLDELINIALLPISGLIKHAAFEDENECRMLYIADISDERIQSPKGDSVGRLYLEYSPAVESHLSKIYLGPQCKLEYKNWLQNYIKRSKFKDIRVKKSGLPLRD